MAGAGIERDDAPLFLRISLVVSFSIRIVGEITRAQPQWLGDGSTP